MIELHNFCVAGAAGSWTGYAAQLNWVPLGPPKCRVYQCKLNWYVYSDFDPVAVNPEERRKKSRGSEVRGRWLVRSILLLKCVLVF